MLLQDLETQFEANRNEANALQMARYMRNLHPFYGIKTPQRTDILKEALAQNGLPTPAELPELLPAMWEKAERDWHYCALDIFFKNAGKCDKTALDLVENLIIQKSWWDTVDYLAPRIAGKLFLRFPEQVELYTSKWIESDNFWLQRAAIIFQLSYKTKTNFPLLCAYIERRKDSKEFFIQKAIGWALRQYARTAPQKVRDFVEHTDPAALSRREAMKHLK
jgi:3-methyladenine DNA glycosylase AlkD